MKKLFLGLVMVLSALTANAQFESGKTYVGVSASNLSMSYSKQTKFNCDLTATTGCFLANDMLVLANFGYNHRDQYDAFEVGLGGRFYIEQNGLYLGISGAYEHRKSSDVRTDNFFLSPEIGYTFFLNQYLTIEPAVYYRMSLNEFSEGSKVGFKLGFGFYF